MARYVYPFASGTSYAHEHWDGGLAVDVFGQRGSAIVACTDGTAEVANFSKGGHTVTLFGDDGREYYHAHLVQGSGVGGRVAIGQLIGLMDNTGNAIDRPTHCHWAAGSIGNDGAGTIAPWALLDAWPRVLGNDPEPPVNPNLRRQLLDWQAARRDLGQDPARLGGVPRPPDRDWRTGSRDAGGGRFPRGGAAFDRGRGAREREHSGSARHLAGGASAAGAGPVHLRRLPCPRDRHWRRRSRPPGVRRLPRRRRPEHGSTLRGWCAGSGRPGVGRSGAPG